MRRAGWLSRGLSALCALWLAACGGSDDGPGAGDDAGTTPGEDAAPEPDYGEGGQSFTVEWGPIEVPPGQENTQCVIKRLGNDKAIRVGEFHNVLGDASHHFIVYRLSEGEEAPEPFECQPFLDTLDPSKGAPLMVTQKAEETLTLPEGVAYTLEPDQLVRLELHYINATDAPKTVQASATFTTISDDDYQADADFLFIGNPDIDIPAGAEMTLGPSFLPLPPALAGSKFFGITGHTHQWGTDVQVATAASADDQGTPVYAPENFLWDEPETVMHTPPFEVPEGGGFRFSCSWVNGSGERVTFGEGANDEMCFFWAYYYPSQGAKVCLHSDAYNADLCCPGDPLCSILQGCLESGDC